MQKGILHDFEVEDIFKSIRLRGSRDKEQREKDKEQPIEYTAELYVKLFLNSKTIKDEIINNSNEQIVDLMEELDLLNSYIELYKIRVQDGLSLHIDLQDKQKKILNMSLQPLLENVIKHNEISRENPLSIYLKQKGDLLIFKNNLIKKNRIIISNGIGLYNLNERYKILVGKEIHIQKSKTHFIVTLPLI